ncbi:MAG: carboxymuconolactone decarboxylase family protein [Gammaproteobacteria bacterium]
MPRLEQKRRAEIEDFMQPIFQNLFGDRDPIDEPGTATGTPGNWWSVFALHPDVFRHATLGFQLYRTEDCLIDAKTRELGQARAGYARGSQFVFSQHCKAARAAGLSEEQIADIPSWSVSNNFSESERAVLAYTDELVLSGGRVNDGVFSEMKKHFSDAAILEFTYVTCMYEMHATICRALRLEYDDIDERVVEIAAPEGSSLDVMNMVDDD